MVSRFLSCLGIQDTGLENMFASHFPITRPISCMTEHFATEFISRLQPSLNTNYT
ncbi:hypothetical protein ABIB82_007553 [Bradyrhizobium sp. i1.8.4]